MNDTRQSTGGSETPNDSPETGNTADVTSATAPATRTSPAGEAAAGDITALVEAYAERLYGYAYRLCGNAATAEDLTQQTFLAAHRNLAQLREPEKALAWLFAIARRVWWKSQRRLAPLTAADLDFDPSDRAQAEPPDEIDHEKLQQALDELPDVYRVVVIMFYFEDCSYQEIADSLELPLGTVMSRLARAKQHLRRRLQSPDAVRGR